MTLQERIQKDSMFALKEGRKDDKSVLTLLLGEIKNKAIEKRVSVLPDADAVNVIQKFVKSLSEEIDGFVKAGRDETVKTLTSQKTLVETYLPKMMTEDEIMSVISGLEDKSMKSIMTKFKTDYVGRVDMSMVSKIARNV